MNIDPDHKLLEQLSSSNEQISNKALKTLYQAFFPAVQRFVVNNSGTPTDAADIFQDAVIAFYTQLKKEKLDLKCSLQTYIYSIARNLWLKRLRKTQRIQPIQDDFDTVEISDNQMNAIVYGERSKIIVQLIEQLGEDCKKVLTYFYFEHLRISNISERMGYSSDQVTKNKKSRCLKQLRTLAKDDTQFIEFFS